jgi:hypothetical protein
MPIYTQEISIPDAAENVVFGAGNIENGDGGTNDHIRE